MKESFNQRSLEAIKNKDFESLLKINNKYIRYLSTTFGVIDQEHLKDIIAAGKIGLFIAYEKYDQTKCASFMGFAWVYIKKEMMDYIYENLRLIRLPRNRIRLIKKGLMDSESDTISLSMSIGDDISLADIIPQIDDEPIDFKRLYIAISTLNDSDKELINKYYGLNGYQRINQKQIADEYNLSITTIHTRVKKVCDLLYLKMFST